MNYKEINLRAKTPESAATEVMYEIASLRADGVGLIRINILYEESIGFVPSPHTHKEFAGLSPLAIRSRFTG